jgi:hypothetical protein
MIPAAFVNISALLFCLRDILYAAEYWAYHVCSSRPSQAVWNALRCSTLPCRLTSRHMLPYVIAWLNVREVLSWIRCHLIIFFTVKESRSGRRTGACFNIQGLLPSHASYLAFKHYRRDGFLRITNIICCWMVYGTDLTVSMELISWPESCELSWPLGSMKIPATLNDLINYSSQITTCPRSSTRRINDKIKEKGEVRKPTNPVIVSGSYLSAFSGVGEGSVVVYVVTGWCRMIEYLDRTLRSGEMQMQEPAAFIVFILAISCCLTHKLPKIL